MWKQGSLYSGCVLGPLSNPKSTLLAVVWRVQILHSLLLLKMCLYVGKHLWSVPFKVGHTGNPSFVDPLHWGHMWMVQIAQVFSLLSWHDYCITCGPRCARGSSSHPLISLFLPSLNVWVGFKDLRLVSNYPAITLACVHPVPSSFKWVFHHSLCVSTWCWGHFWNISAYLIALELYLFYFLFFWLRCPGFSYSLYWFWLTGAHSGFTEGSLRKTGGPGGHTVCPPPPLTFGSMIWVSWIQRRYGG